MNKFLVTLLVVAAPLVAKWNCFTGGVEALYWKPCNAALTYGEFSHTSDPAETDIQLKVNPNYEWGFRLFARATNPCCNNYADLEWARLETSTAVLTLDNHPPQALSSFPWVSSESGARVTQIGGRQRTRYNKVSLKLGHTFCSDCCARLAGYVGGRWLDIRVKKQVIGAIPVATSTQVGDTSSCTTYCAGALEVGLAADVDVWCGFGLSSRFGLMGTFGTRDHSYTQWLLTGALNRINQDNHSLCTGGYEVRAGINYTKECRCWLIRGEIGYELDHYFDVLLDEQTNVQSPSTLTNSFRVGGPYIGLSVTF